MTDQKKVMIVTGASRGIGAATAVHAAREGYSVCINFLNNEAKAQKVVESIEAEGGKALKMKADVGDPEQVVRLFTSVDEKLGRVDALVNNAGISGRRCKMIEQDTESIMRVLEVNLLGCMLCSREAVKRMAKSFGGSGGGIVNLSSQAAFFGGKLIAPYAASKAAINNFTLALSKEVASEGIRVNAVSPGIIETDQHDLSDPKFRAQITKDIPVGRMGNSEEVAEVIHWLLSKKASYVNGIVLPVSGGK